jgi:hypothetical protein
VLVVLVNPNAKASPNLMLSYIRVSDTLKFMQGWDLVLDTAGVIKNVIDAKKIKTQDFFGDILGKDWSNFLPSSWLSECESGH